MSLLIDQLVVLGVACLKKAGLDGSPDEYARKAAHITVRDTTSAKGAASPDSIAFMQSINALSALLVSAHLSARLADKSAAIHRANQQYDCEFSYTGSATTRAADETVSSYEGGLCVPEMQALIQKAHAAYEQIKQQRLAAGEKVWNDSMCMRYLHVYAAARAAYLHAIAVAAPYSDAQLKSYLFAQSIRARLQADIQNEPLAPGFLLRIMLSDEMKKAGILLLIASALALALLLGGIISPAVHLALSTLCVSNTILIPAVVAGGGSGSTLLVSRFFINKHQLHRAQLIGKATEQANHIMPKG